MESNGKRVTLGGNVLAYETGVINFGEPGTSNNFIFDLIFVVHFYYLKFKIFFFII